jgi:hypothetical protein
MNMRHPPPCVKIVDGRNAEDPRDDRRMRNRAEEMRRRYRYRRLIVRGRLRLSRGNATRLVGPDCAYHLYRAIDREGPRRAEAEDEDGR